MLTLGLWLVLVQWFKISFSLQSLRQSPTNSTCSQSSLSSSSDSAWSTAERFWGERYRAELKRGRRILQARPMQKHSSAMPEAKDKGMRSSLWLSQSQFHMGLGDGECFLP